MIKHLGAPQKFYLVTDPTEISELRDIITLEPITAIQIGRIIIGGGNTLGDAIRRWEAEHSEIYPEELKTEAIEDAKRRLETMKITKMAKKITPETKKWINAVLHNDEASTDEELVQHFIKEGKLTEEMARKAVSQRGKALRDPYYSVKL